MKIKECCTVESQECIAKGIYSMWISTKVIAKEARTETYYKRRPCADYVASAARLIGEKLNEVSEEM